MVAVEGQTAGVVGVAGSAVYFDRLDRYRAALLMLGLLVVGVVVVVSFAVSHRLTRPMGRLVAAIRKFGRGELREPVVIRTRDEIGFLGEAFNDMRQSLDRRDEQMQLMLSGIAHEVRNPLAGMELFCSLLSDELTAHPEQRAHVEKISRELQYLGRVVNDFLRFARRRPLSPERLDAAGLINEVVDGLMGAARQSGVELVLEVEDGVELTGEREALRGVIANLVQNALQACDSGGKVTVRVTSSRGWRELEIVDTGRGIPEERRKHIFEPFFTTKEQGTGLGLALVHKSVQEHGGDIAVQSKPNEGTRFVIRLPFDAQLTPPATRARLRAHRGRCRDDRIAGRSRTQ